MENLKLGKNINQNDISITLKSSFYPGSEITYVWVNEETVEHLVNRLLKLNEYLDVIEIKKIK